MLAGRLRARVFVCAGDVSSPSASAPVAAVRASAAAEQSVPRGSGPPHFSSRTKKCSTGCGFSHLQSPDMSQLDRESWI